MLDLLALRAFIRTAESGSLTAAARQTGMTTSGVGKAVSRLEDHLGVRLLTRTTRHVRLTDEGAGFYERARAILAELEDAELSVMRGRVEPRGRLTVDASQVIARQWLMPRIPEFLARYPDLTLTLILEEKRVDLAHDGVDVAIRIGEQLDSAQIVRQLTAVGLVTCAAPSYFARHGVPQTPVELGNHNCLAMVRDPDGRVLDWQFMQGETPLRLSVGGSFSASRGQALVDAARGGMGIVQLPDYYLEEAIRVGQLVPCLGDFTAPGPTISILYLRRRHLSPKVRAFVDFAVEVFAERRSAPGPKQKARRGRSRGGLS